VIYKIIAKCIASRLKPHLPDYIHPYQQAFIKGRRISNNIIIAQEIAHCFALKSWKNKAFMLKIDLAKAFDRVEWNFIVTALARKGLHSHFINLIHACIASPTFFVIINGQPCPICQQAKHSNTRPAGLPATLATSIWTLGSNHYGLY
jgi:hypothetical protein